jgi:hypothetical protein
MVRIEAPARDESRRPTATPRNLTPLRQSSTLPGMIFCDATGVLGETARRLYPGLTRTGASGARGVGRPKYLMSCELVLLSGRLCDLPGCAVSADP